MKLNVLFGTSRKRYVETDRAFGKFLIISVRLTVLGVDHVESENKRGTIGTEM